jgi:hypothetical protein
VLMTRYLLLFDSSTTMENTTPILLAACVLWSLSSNGYMRHSMKKENALMLETFISGVQME